MKQEESRNKFIDVKDLCSETCNTMFRKIKDINIERHILYLLVRIFNTVKMSVLLKLTCRSKEILPKSHWFSLYSFENEMENT